MAQGGARPGAGRKKGHKASHTVQAEKAREYFIARVVAELEPLLTKQIELAKAGDAQMLRYLTDQVVGKAKETHEHQGSLELKIDF